MQEMDQVPEIIKPTKVVAKGEPRPEGREKPRKFKKKLDVETRRAKKELKKLGVPEVKGGATNEEWDILLENARGRQKELAENWLLDKGRLLEEELRDRLEQIRRERNELDEDSRDYQRLDRLFSMAQKEFRQMFPGRETERRKRPTPTPPTPEPAAALPPPEPPRPSEPPPPSEPPTPRAVPPAGTPEEIERKVRQMLGANEKTNLRVISEVTDAYRRSEDAYKLIDTLPDGDAKSKLSELKSVRDAFQEAWVVWIEKRGAGLVEGYKDGVDKINFPRAFEVLLDPNLHPGVAEALRLIEQRTEELIKDEGELKDKFTSDPPNRDNPWTRFRDEKNWETIVADIAEKIRPSAGVLAQDHARLAYRLWDYTQQWSYIAGPLAGKEKETSFGGPEYQDRRVHAANSWTKIDGKVATQLIDEIDNYLKSKHEDYRLYYSGNFIYWGPFLIEAAGALYKKDGTEIKLDDYFDPETRTLTKNPAGFPWEEIDWRRMDSEKLSRWIYADGAEADKTRDLFANPDAKTGILYNLGTTPLESGYTGLVEKGAWDHLGHRLGKGKNFELIVWTLDKLGDLEPSLHRVPRESSKFKENVFKFINRGLYWGSLWESYNLSFPQIKSAQDINEVKIAQLLLSVHDEQTLLALGGNRNFLSWLQQAALGNIQTSDNRQKYWASLLSDLRFDSPMSFHQNIILEPMKARVRWNERADLFRARSEMLTAIDNLTFKENHKLLYLTNDELKEVREGKATVDEILARKKISDELVGQRVIGFDKLLRFLADSGKPVEHRFAVWPFEEGQHISALEDLIATLDIENPAIERAESALTPDNIRDLIIRAEQQGKISPNMAAELIRRFGMHEFRAARLGDALRRGRLDEAVKELWQLAPSPWTIKEVVFEFWDPVEKMYEGLGKFLGGALRIGEWGVPIPRLTTMDVLSTVAATLLGAAGGGFFGGMTGYLMTTYWSKTPVGLGGIVRYFARSKTAPKWRRVWTSVYDKKPEILDELVKAI